MMNLSKWNSTIVEKQLCSGHLGEVKGSAQGDSGGPLVAEDEDHGGWSVVGIVSWGSTRYAVLPLSTQDLANFSF